MTCHRVMFLRHGQTDHNVERRVQGSIDIPLNKIGQQQAAAAGEGLARILKDEDVTIISSPLSRAYTTAKAVADRLEVSITTDPRLRERGFGRFEGLSATELQATYPEEYALWKNGGAPAGVGIESTADVAARMSEAVLQYADRLPSASILLVVAHGSAITQTLRHLLGVSTDGGPVIRGMDNCHWAEIERGEFQNGATWRLHSLNRSV